MNLSLNLKDLTVIQGIGFGNCIMIRHGKGTDDSLFLHGTADEALSLASQIIAVAQEPDAAVPEPIDAAATEPIDAAPAMRYVESGCNCEFCSDPPFEFPARA